MLKRRASWWRIGLGGFAGSIIILLNFTSIASTANHPITKLCFSFAMVLITFGYKRLSFFIKAVFFLYLSTFLSGGTLIGVHYFIKFDSRLTEEVLLGSVQGFGDPISWLFVMLGFPIVWYLSRKGVASLEITKIQFDQLVNVDLFIQDLVHSFKGLVDSGNQLYDPITKAPVMIISIQNVKEQLPIELLQMIVNPDEYIFGTKEIPAKWENKIKMIPCKVVGQDHQIVIAFKPDQLEIRTEEETIKVTKALISFTMQQLSSDDAFQCIVHPKMLTAMKQGNNSSKVS
jgi:stage II sporulation protein GA (sporulation sigma-E factor processing peptidase)